MTPTEQVRERLASGDVEGAWAALEPRRGDLADDGALARLWLSLHEATPGRPSLADDVDAIVAAHPDPETALAAGQALLATAQRRAPDEPILGRGPAHRAADIAEAALAGDPGPLAPYLWALRGNALRLCGHQEDEAAQRAFAQALEAAPEEGGFWFDLGLLHKWRGRFQEGLDCALRARARLGEEKRVLWNLAICATALGEGDIAAGVWRDLGMEVSLSSAGMPHVPGLPAMQVRVPARGPGLGVTTAVPDEAATFEVLWVAPLSPCHGVVQSPSFRDAVVDYGDVVLWDGAPVSVARGPRGPIPRFPLLEILRRGEEQRLRFVALQGEGGRVARLEEHLPEGARLFLHREHIEWVAPSGARGAAPDAGPGPDEPGLFYGKIVTGPDADLRALAEALRAGAEAVGDLALAIPDLYDRLGDARRAGQEHQAFRGLEVRAEKRGLVSAKGER